VKHAKDRDTDAGPELENYDPDNAFHRHQWQNAGCPDLSELDASGNPWRPFALATDSVFNEPSAKVDRSATVASHLDAVKSAPAKDKLAALTATVEALADALREKGVL